MTGAKPLYRFRDRALAGLMAARGWISELQLTPLLLAFIPRGTKPNRHQ
jgi:hypothetical protein